MNFEGGWRNIWSYMGWEEKGVLDKCMTLLLLLEVLTCWRGSRVWALSCRKPSQFEGKKDMDICPPVFHPSMPVLCGCCLLHWHSSRPAQASWTERSNCIALLPFRENLRYLDWILTVLMTTPHSVPWNKWSERRRRL